MIIETIQILKNLSLFENIWIKWVFDDFELLVGVVDLAFLLVMTIHKQKRYHLFIPFLTNKLTFEN